MIDQKSKGYLYGACRRIFRWSPVRTACLNAAYVKSEKVLVKGKKGKKDKLTTYKFYKCVTCSIVTKDVHVDHIDPIGTWVDWNTFIDRLFCDSSNLQVLCKKCHKLKTKKEAHERAKSH